MTAKSRTSQERTADSPEWIFPWRDPVRSPWPKLLATGIVCVAFAFLFAGVRVRMEQSPRGTERKASVIYLPAEGEGQAWSLRAREDGPFPSRFDPFTWGNQAGQERAIFDAARVVLQPYVPVLRDLPTVNPVGQTQLSAKEGRVFPKRKATSPAVSPTGNLKLAPVLYPLSGISAAGMPAELPPFTGLLDAAATSVPWRSFLVRLHPGGGVAECVSLTDSEAISKSLEQWLRGVKFNAEPTSGSEWIALAVTFTNQSADGPVAR